MSQCWSMHNETHCWLVSVFVQAFKSFIRSSWEMWVICGVCCFWGQRAEEQTNNPSSPRFTRPHWNSWGRRWRSLSANQNRLSEVNAQTPLLIWFFYSAASLFGSRRNYPKSDLAKLAKRLGIGHPSHAQRSQVSVGSFPSHLLLQIHFRQTILS